MWLLALSVLVVLIVALVSVLWDPLHRLRPLFRHAGYLDGTAGHHLYYVFLPNPDPDVPVILWLNGGPGFPSMVGMFLENGPLRMDEHMHWTKNMGAWTPFVHMLYLDAPVHTGWSYAEDGAYSDEHEMVEDITRALTQFFQGTGQPYAQNKFYMGGQSYGSHVIPQVATRYPVDGVILANGWVDPYHQLQTTLDMCQKVLTDVPCQDLEPLQTRIFRKIEQGTYREATEAAWQMDAWITAYSTLNKYNIHQQAPFPDMHWLDAYVNTPAIRSLMKGHGHWTWYNAQVREHFEDTMTQSVAPHVQHLLDRDIPVLVLYGDLDGYVNPSGVETWVHALPWQYQHAFQQTSARTLRVEDQARGTIRQYPPLTLVQVDGAGHLTLHDQPRVGQAVLKMWLAA